MIAPILKSKNITIVIQILMGLHILASWFIILFKDYTYNIDLECFLYLGQRLNQGELLFVNDFETKLPIVQYFFGLAFKFGGIGAWNILCIINGFLFGLWGSYYLSKFYYNLPNSKYSAASLTQFFLLIFLTLNIPTEIEKTLHIEQLSVAWIYFSVCLLIYNLKHQKLLNYFYIGFFLSISILIRLNYLFFVPLTYIIIWIQQNDLEKITILNKCKQTIYFSIGGIAGLLIISFPYILIHNGNCKLLDGILAIFSYSDGIPFSILFRRHLAFSPFFFIPFYLNCLILVLLITKNKVFLKNNFLELLMIIFLTPIFLFFSFLRSHYWDHYYIMYVFLVPFNYLILLKFPFLNFRIKFIIYLFFGSIFIYPVFQSYKLFKEVINNNQLINWNINDRNINADLVTFLLKKRNEGIKFYVIDGPIYHAYLNEKRMGDGHPFILNKLLDNNSVHYIPSIFLFQGKNLRNPSDIFKFYNKKIIVFNRNNIHQKLIQNLEKNQNLHAKILSPPKLNDYIIYELTY